MTASFLDSDAIKTLPSPQAQKLALWYVVGANNATIPTSPAKPPPWTAVPKDLHLCYFHNLFGQPPAPGYSLHDGHTFLTNKMEGEKFYDIEDFVPGVLTRGEKTTLPGCDSEVILNIGAQKRKLESVNLQ